MRILDIKMPEMNGFELYRQMKKIDDKAKVCFLTASEMYYGVYTDIYLTDWMEILYSKAN
jgi:two-component system catabolic regulation response regulator CreB/two-component system response regulator ChvI